MSAAAEIMMARQHQQAVVLIYHDHDPGGYSIRDQIIRELHHHLNNSPVEWEPVVSGLFPDDLDRGLETGVLAPSAIRPPSAIDTKLKKYPMEKCTDLDAFGTDWLQGRLRDDLAPYIEGDRIAAIREFEAEEREQLEALAVAWEDDDA